MDAGYLTLWGIKCTCYIDKDRIVAVSLDRNTTFPFEHNFNKDFFIEYYGTRGKNIAKIKSVTIPESNVAFLYPKYILKRSLSEYFCMLEITGDAVDDFFSPSRYFYNKSVNNDKIEGNLLYDGFVADEWNIVYDNQNINVNLSYGNILSRGVFSDLKLKAKITISFKETKDIEFVYNLLSLIIKLLKIIGCCNNIGILKTELFNKNNNGFSLCGELNNYNGEEEYYKKHIGAYNYSSYKDYIFRFLKFVADNPDYPTSHFPKTGFRNSDNEYTYKDFIDIFNTFELECHENYDLYIKKDQEGIVNIKKEVLAKVDEIQKNNLTNEEKDYIEGVKSKIGSYGNELSLNKRVFNAYCVAKESLKDSIDRILYLHKYKSNNKLDDKIIKDISKHLTSDIRNGIYHGDYHCEFDEFDKQDIHFLEILVYVMMLKRASFTDNEISKIIGTVFHVNNILTNELLENSDKN